jgi:hypothetical protein
VVKSWLIRLWSLATLFTAALGALLGLLPFTTTLGLVLLVVSLISGAVFLLTGRGRFGELRPRSTRFFAWWTVSLSALSLVLVLTLTGALGGCEREVESAAEEARGRELIEQ